MYCISANSIDTFSPSMTTGANHVLLPNQQRSYICLSQPTFAQATVGTHFQQPFQQQFQQL